MDQYVVPPEDCLVLLALAKSPSLRGAARLLHCDPAGLMRKVQRLAQDHGLLRKVRGKWELTEEAQGLVAWTQESMLSQRKVLQSESTLRLAATTWFAERVLIPGLPKLTHHLAKTGPVKLSSPTHDFEGTLMNGDCDFVIACHPPENPVIAHKQIMSEPWSIIISPAKARQLRRNHKLSLADLKSVPFIRHSGANPSALFPQELPFELHSELSIDHLTGIRAACLNELGWSLVPSALVADELKAQSLVQVGERLDLGRKICLWHLRSSSESKRYLPPLSSWLRAACEKI